MDVEKARTAIRETLKSFDQPAEVAEAVAFHLTDWDEELVRFYAFMSDPARLTPREAYKVLMDFVVHVPNHLAAASKVWLDIPVADVFGVGATTEARGPDASKSS